MATTSYNDIAEAIYLSSKDKGSREMPLHLKNVVNFLAKRRMISKAPEILSRLKKIIDKENGLITAKVWTAHKLSNQTKHDLAHALTKRYRAREVFFEETVDEKLIGGFKVEVGDEVIDLTLKNKVGKLQEYLIRQ